MACELADNLDMAGAAVIVPHLSMLWHLTSPQGIGTWYPAATSTCWSTATAWCASTGEGADREWAMAQELGIERWSLPAGFLDVSPSMEAWIEAMTLTHGGPT